MWATVIFSLVTYCIFGLLLAGFMIYDENQIAAYILFWPLIFVIYAIRGLIEILKGK